MFWVIWILKASKKSKIRPVHFSPWNSVRDTYFSIDAFVTAFRIPHIEFQYFPLLFSEQLWMSF